MQYLEHAVLNSHLLKKYFHLLYGQARETAKIFKRVRYRIKDSVVIYTYGQYGYDGKRISVTSEKWWTCACRLHGVFADREQQLLYMYTITLLDWNWKYYYSYIVMHSAQKCLSDNNSYVYYFTIQIGFAHLLESKDMSVKNRRCKIGL